MKPSEYNFFYEFPRDSNELIAYNSRTNSLALIEKEKYSKYRNFKDKHIPIDDEELVKDLRRGQFLIDDDIDELELLRFRLLSSRFDNRNLYMTIAPTMNCNFNCIYCYEKPREENIFMTEEV